MKKIKWIFSSTYIFGEEGVSTCSQVCQITVFFNIQYFLKTYSLILYEEVGSDPVNMDYVSQVFS